MRCLFILILLFVGDGSASAQTTMEKFKVVCETKASTYVSNICTNQGEISRFSLNMPRLCREKGWGNQISEALKECRVGNLYSDIWKFIYNDDIGTLQMSVASYVEEGVSNGAVRGFEGLDRFGLFEIFYLSCAKDSACHRNLFAVIPQELQSELAKTPLFCDYRDDKVIQFSTVDDSVMIDENDPTGFAHPTCREYYCLRADCSKISTDKNNNDLFILSNVWDSYYKRVYEGNLDD